MTFTPDHTRLYSSRLSIAIPQNFDFWRTAYSHGWCALPPFSHNVDTRTLGRIFSLAEGITVACSISEAGGSIRVVALSLLPLMRQQRLELKAQIRTCFRLDEDFSELYKEAMRYPRYRWIAQRRAGRMLRSPTVFEDVVKMLCTTNCTWTLTTLMVTNLVQHFGKKFNDSASAFPDPEAIAATSEQYLRTKIKAGYRAPYILKFAEDVASNSIDVEGWRVSRLETDELYQDMRSVKGIGPYAAGNLMKLVGRYDYLGIDSWVRSKYYELYHGGRRVKDATIETRYKPYGRWRGLFFWLEMTRYWHDQKFRL